MSIISFMNNPLVVAGLGIGSLGLGAAALTSKDDGVRIFGAGFATLGLAALGTSVLGARFGPMYFQHASTLPTHARFAHNAINVLSGVAALTFTAGPIAYGLSRR